MVNKAVIGSNEVPFFLNDCLHSIPIYCTEVRVESISCPPFGESEVNFESMPLQDLMFSSLDCIKVPKIKNVIFNNPATIVYWEDGTKTVVKCQTQTGDTYSKETGLAMCFVKKVLGNKGNFNEVLKEWCK